MAKDTYLTFSNTIELFRINTRNVVYIQASGNYSELFTADGKKHELPMQLGQVEMKLDACLENNPDAHFVRIGKQVIANVDYILYPCQPQKTGAFRLAHLQLHSFAVGRGAEIT